jgi:CTP synthase
MRKYIFVTGGVCSSLGKGITAASLGSLLEHCGHTIRMVKIDPYINVDAGTMSPYQHGEVYVTDDGAETDLDLGNYARFTSSPLSKDNSITTGQIYQEVIQKERQGRYLGRTVQVIPHITDEIKQRIYRVGKDEDHDIIIIEIGGTVGDIESIPFLEAARQIMHEQGPQNAISAHLTLVPQVPGGELKTKPTQHSVKEMREIGIQPDLLLCRSPRPIDDAMRRKISLFTNVEFEAVISAYDVPNTIYEIPLILKNYHADTIVLKKLNLEGVPAENTEWDRVVNIFTGAGKTVKIAVVGKYIDLHDSYKSVDEALYHGGIANECRVELIKIDSEKIEKDPEAASELNQADGILIPGGFGQRGIEGMIKVASFARLNNIPYFGICLGMQVMVIEYARTVLNLEDADSTEFKPECPHPVISLLEEQIDITNYGGTMRLGESSSHLMENSKIKTIYGQEIIKERHRHRYEVSNAYREQLDDAGLKVCGVTPDKSLVEAMEWYDHPWGIGVQFHPEFKSKPVDAHPLFCSFIESSIAGKENRIKTKELVSNE